MTVLMLLVVVAKLVIGLGYGHSQSFGVVTGTSYDRLPLRVSYSGGLGQLLDGEQPAATMLTHQEAMRAAASLVAGIQPITVEVEYGHDTDTTPRLQGL